MLQPSKSGCGRGETKTKDCVVRENKCEKRKKIVWKWDSVRLLLLLLLERVQWTFPIFPTWILEPHWRGLRCFVVVEKLHSVCAFCVFTFAFVVARATDSEGRQRKRGDNRCLENPYLSDLINSTLGPSSLCNELVFPGIYRFKLHN